MPVYGFSTDVAVLAQYEQIMPGYEIIGYDCNQIIPANGAIHCIAMKVPAMLFQDSCAQWSKGDVNADDVVDIIDVLIAVDIILNSGEAQPCVYFAADMDEDGNVTFFDVIQILNIIMDL